MDLINNRVFDGLNSLVVSLEELYQYKDYVLGELLVAKSVINNGSNTDEELRLAEVQVNYYSNELNKVDDKLNEVICSVNSIKAKVDCFKTQRADIIDESVRGSR